MKKKKKMIADTIGEINNWKIYLKKNLSMIRFFLSNIFVFKEKYRIGKIFPECFS